MWSTVSTSHPAGLENMYWVRIVLFNLICWIYLPNWLFRNEKIKNKQTKANKQIKKP